MKERIGYFRSTKRRELVNKKLVAVAVGAALTVNAFAAQAEVPEVKIYGKLHLSLDSINDDSGDAGGVGSSVYASSNSSRIGFKGTQVISPSLKFVWQYEQGVNVTDSGGTFATRNSFGGLAGNFGTVLIGYHDSPFKTLGRKVDLFGDQIGDARNLTRQSHGGLGFDERLKNVVAWVSPKWGGVSVVAAYKVEDGTKDANAFSASVSYSGGPLLVGAAVESHGKGISGGTFTETSTGTRLGVSYKISAFKVNALYQQISNAGGNKDQDVSVYGLGGAFQTGDHTIKAQYYAADDYGDTSNSGASLIAVGYDYALDKSTKVYAAYAAVSNDGNASYTAFGGGHGENPTVAAGRDPSAFSVGMVYKF